MGDYIQEVLVPSEIVTEVKNGKKTTRNRSSAGYIFIKMRLYDEAHKILQKPWYFVQETQGVIGFVGEIIPRLSSLLKLSVFSVKWQKLKEKPKIQFEVAEIIKINDGPFANLNGEITEIDADRGKLKVSVSIFGRETPVELEYWQVNKTEEE